MMFTTILCSGVLTIAYTNFAGCFGYEGTFENLLYGIDRLLENPVVMSWITSCIVSIGGWLENYTHTKEKFSAEKFAETVFYYLPALTLISQYFPMPLAVFFSFGIDVARRIAKRIASP